MTINVASSELVIGEDENSIEYAYSYPEAFLNQPETAISKKSNYSGINGLQAEPSEILGVKVVILTNVLESTDFQIQLSKGSRWT